MIISWVLWIEMSLFPLLESELFKILSLLFIYIYLVFALVLAYDFILDMVFILTFTITIHNMINKECYYYTKISDYNIFVWFKMVSRELMRIIILYLFDSGLILF